MIQRELLPHVQQLAKQYPVVTILGPRQSGKTTLTKQAFPQKKYVNLEHPITREFAQEDPVSFLASLKEGAVIDEIQRVPELLSYIQVIVDEQDIQGYFILTGSHQFNLRNSINQSLAGRTAILRLLPFSISEVSSYGEMGVEQLMFKGFYPRVHEVGIDPNQAYGDYFETYIERDLRQIIEVKNLSAFQKFMRLLAGRVGSLLNLANLANDVGVSQPTVKEWLSILEASFVCFQLQSWQPTIRKRLIKTPKIYFYDVGLATMLLGIEEEKQLGTHPLRGNLYENLVIADVLKSRFNKGKRNNLYFYRDSNGNEVDLLYEIAGRVIPVEIKSGQTLTSSYFKGLNHFSEIFNEQIVQPVLVYGGGEKQVRNGIHVTNEKSVVDVIEEVIR